MKFLLKILVLFFITTCVFSNHLKAQSNWKKITVIKTNGDTIHGEFFFKNKFKTFKSLIVRDEKSKAQKFFFTKDISSFFIEAEEQKLYFKTLRIEADYSSNDPTHISGTPNVTLIADTVFAQLLVGGARNLYYFKDARVFKNHYLLETQAGKAIDLIKKSYYLDEGRIAVGYNELYKKQLLQELNNSLIISIEKINALPFSKDAFVKLIKDYNQSALSSEKATSYEYKNEKAKFHLGAVVGGNRTSIRFNGSLQNYNQMNLNASYGVNAGISLNIILPQTRKRVSVYNELLFSNYQFNSSAGLLKYEEEYSQDIYYMDASIKAYLLKLVTAVRFQLPQPLTPFFQAGIVNGFAINKSNTATIGSYPNSTIKGKTRPFLSFRTYEQSIFAGAGICFKKMGAEFRYELGNGIAEDLEGSSTISYAYLLLSYRF